MTKDRIEMSSGYVELIDVMGDDYRILEAARTSTGAKARKGDEKDEGLIRYLFKNEHTSPFEFAQITFKIKCPIFVARQVVRHRTAKMNEASARYQEFEWDTYKPEKWRQQDTINKQSSSEDSALAPLFTSFDREIDRSYAVAEESYSYLLKNNVAREQARTVMPVGQATEFFWSMDLHNLFHFLKLRLHPHAQKEIRELAEAILVLLKDTKTFIWSIQIFEEKMRIDFALKDKMTKLDSKGMDALLKHIELFSYDKA